MAWISHPLAFFWYLVLALAAGVIPAQLQPPTEPPPAQEIAANCPESGFPAAEFRARLAELRDLNDFSRTRDIETVHTLFLYELAYVPGCPLISAEPIPFLLEPRTLAEAKQAVAVMAEALGIQAPRVSTDFERCPSYAVACAIRERGNTTLVFSPDELLIFPLLHEFAHHADWEILGKTISTGPISMHSRTWVNVLAWMLTQLAQYNPTTQCGWAEAADLGLAVCRHKMHTPIE